MVLRQEFLAGIKAAEQHFGVDPAGWSVLHKIITGPPQSGKSTLARSYAWELMTEGFIKNPPLEIDCAQPYSDQQLQHFFNEANGGMIVVKNPQATTRQETLVARLERAIEKDEAIVVLIGADDAIHSFLGANPSLTKKLNLDKPPAVIVTTEKSFTPEEQAAFAVAQPDAWLQREKERRTEKILREWNEMKDFDVTVGREVVAPGKASFAKRAAKVT